jgi:hypothetical protein
MSEFIFGLGVVGVALVLTLTTFISRFLLICHPNEVISHCGLECSKGDQES